MTLIILGDFDGSLATGFSGWCWSPDEPDRRLVVELLFDGRVVSASIAASFRSDLLSHGMGDGRHGFQLMPKDFPRPASQPNLIEARERATGTVLGRLMSGNPEDKRWSEQITDAAARLAEAASAISALSSPRDFRELPSPQICFAAGPVSLTGYARNAPPRVARGDPGVSLMGTAPRLSVVVDAPADPSTVFARLRQAVQIADTEKIEFIVIGPADDPQWLIEAALLPRTQFITAPNSRSRGTRLDEAMAHARSGRLAVVEARALSAVGLLAISQCRSPVVLGREATRLAQGQRLALLVEREAFFETGLCILIDREVIQAIGGFAAVPDGGGGQLELEVALRASMIGYELLTMIEPDGGFQGCSGYGS